MALSVLELAWTEIVTAFEAINTATDPGDGGGNYRNTIVKVYKRPMRMDEVPDFPSICVWPYKPTLTTPNTAKTVVEVSCEFIVAVFVHSYSDEDATTGQTQLSEDYMSLWHDVMRVVLGLTLSHVNSSTVRFTALKPTAVELPVDELGRTYGVFGFKLPVMIRWYGRGLVA